MATGLRGEANRRTKRKDERWGRLEVGWPVRRCGSGDYRKRVPSMGSTRVQDIAEDQGVRRQKEDQTGEPRRGTKKRNRRKKKTPASVEGKLIVAGGKILR